MSWLIAGGAAVTLRLHIQPGAKKSEIAGLHGEALKIRLAAPPVDGRANACLIAFVADRLGIATSQISMVSGSASRAKRICISGVDPALIRRRFAVTE
jgi:uncharacterized protein (TIGR00251 family)